MSKRKERLRRDIKKLEDFNVGWLRPTPTEIDILLEKHQKPKVSKGVHIRLGFF